MTFVNNSPHHTIQRKRQKNLLNIPKKTNNFMLVIVDTPPNICNEERNILGDSFVSSTVNKSDELVFQRVLNHLLKCWNENKTHKYPSSTAMSQPENIPLNFTPSL